MNDRKTIYHIELERDKSAFFWSFLTENFEIIIDKKQHSVDGKDLNVYIRIAERKL